MTRRLGPDAAADLLAPTARVLASPGCATPATLLAALGRRALGPDDATGRAVVAGLLLGDMPWVEAVQAGRLGLRTWHPSGPARRLVDDGTADYVPLRLGDLSRSLPGSVDAMVLRVSPPGTDGTCSIGPSGSYTRAGVAAVRAVGGLVIGEVDPDLPVTAGPTRLDVADIDVLVDADEAARTYRPAAWGDAHRCIAETVVGLLPDHPTVQLGIGAVPEAVASAMAALPRASLRLVGMASDGVVDLSQAGIVDGPVRVAEILGSASLLRWAHHNDAVEVHPSSTIHDPAWIAAHDRFVSVNAALEVDLGGQVALEGAGGRALAGVGGSVDFFEGARRSDGGLRIVALLSEVDGVSRIVGRLDPGAAVSLPRHSVDLVVTEHGVADLRGRSLAERAEALVAVAAPSQRDALAGWVGRVR